MIATRTALTASAILALAILGPIETAGAQPYGRGPGGPGPGMMGQGMMGPAMMGRGSFNRMCSPASAGFAEWRMDQLESILKPTDAQRAKLDEFKAASGKAAEAMRSACSADVPTTAVGRMQAMEKRLDAMSAAIKTVRPPFEAFYATLTGEQKAQIDSNDGRGRFWRGRDRW
jgi:LTXXQ motif family protein